MSSINIVIGDITKLNVDGIVNAANASLCGGGGVDGAIHKAAGKELLAECRTLGGCKTGFAKITKGYQLSAKHIIHTVGPVWYGGHRNEPALLASCYRECLKLALKHNLKSLAFPAISCGSYRFPLEMASHIAISTLIREIELHNSKIEVLLVCFDEKSERRMNQVYKGLFEEGKWK